MMKPGVKRILAIITGMALGSAVNMLILHAGTAYMIPPPAGANISSPEALAASMPLFQPKHFVFPFLAHALGTLFGSVTAALISPLSPLRTSLPVGILFLLGGAYMVYELPSPAWFNVLDLTCAYIPMAFAGAVLVKKIREARSKNN